MSKKLLRCIDCNRLLLLGPHNRAPSYRFRGADLEPIELHCDDEAAFRKEHQEHATDTLTVVAGSYVSNGVWGDPMRESFFEATNGEEIFVVRRWRTHLDRPVIYEVLPGVLDVRTVAIEVQKSDLERQLEVELGETLDSEFLRRFVKTVEDIAGDLDHSDLEEVCIDRRDPLINYLRLSDKHVAEILDRLGEDIPADALKNLRNFIIRNSEGDDVMNLIARKAFAVGNPSPDEPSATGL